MAESRQGEITCAVSCLAHLPEDHRCGEAFHIPAELKENEDTGSGQHRWQHHRPAPLLPTASSQTTRAQKGHRGTLTTCQASRLQIGNHHPCLFPRSDRPGVSWGLSQRAGLPSRIHFLMASGRSGGHSPGQVLSGRILRLEEAGAQATLGAHGGPAHSPPGSDKRLPVSASPAPLPRQLCGPRRSQACSWRWALSGGQARPQLAGRSRQLVLDVGSGRRRRIDRPRG